MIAEWVMEQCGFDSVWYLGSNRGHPRWWQFLGPRTCYVGIWTGPEMDLICVKKCKTNQEADKYLSPPGWTIAHAALLSWWELHRVGQVATPKERAGAVLREVAGGQ